MGLYYNPNPPHIGAQQPLEPKKLTPPQSGPTPDNPPPIGTRLERAVAILTAWAVLYPGPPLPPVASRLTPPISGASETVPPNNGDFARQLSVWENWRSVYPDAPLPPVASRLTPPQTGYSPTRGSAVAAEVLVAWDIQPPPPIVARNLTPASAPVATNPTFAAARVPAWFDDVGLPDALLVRRNLVPVSGPAASNPPFAGGARVPYEVLIWWIPPDPQPPAAGKLTPPSAVAPSGPPLGGGALVPQPVLVSWLLPVPASIVGRKLVPPISGPEPTTTFLRGAQVSLEVLASWEPPVRQLQPRQPLSPVSAPSFPFQGSRVSAETLTWWIASPPAPFLARYRIPVSASAPDNPPLVLPAKFWQTVYGAALDWYAAQNYQTLVRVSFTPSGPSVQPVVVEPPGGGGKRKKKPVRPIWDRGPEPAEVHAREPAPIAKPDAPVQKAKAPQGPADKVRDQLLPPVSPAPLQQESKASKPKPVLARSPLAEVDDVVSAPAALRVVEDDDRVLAEANQLPWRLAAVTLREDADEIFASAFEDDDEEAMRLLLDGDGDILAYIHREDKDSFE